MLYIMLVFIQSKMTSPCWWLDQTQGRLGDQSVQECKLVVGSASVEEEARVLMDEAKMVAVFKRKQVCI